MSPKVAFVALKFLASREFNRIDCMFVKDLNPLDFVYLFVNDFLLVDLIFDKGFLFVGFIISNDFNSLDFIFVAFVEDSFVALNCVCQGFFRCF